MSSASSPSSVCPVCGSADAFTVVEVAEVPVLCNVLLEDRASARGVPRGELHLAGCASCAHVYNSAFRPDRLRYDAAYENSLHFSPTFDAYARGLARSLVDRYDLRGGTVLEIGCGQGRFLQLLTEAGVGGALGYDPSFDPDRAGFEEGRVRIHAESFPPERPGEPVDLICSRHVLEHVPELDDFVRAMRTYGTASPEPGVLAEVPNGRFVFEDLAVWDLIYEHYSFFSAHSLAELFARGGFAVDRVYSAYADQFLCLEGRLNGRSGSEDAPSSPEDRDAYLEDLRAFGDRFERKRARWADRIGAFRERGRDTVLWGAGSKAVSLVNLLESADGISRLVDVNPRKQGRFVSGTGHEIVAPSDLEERPPDVVVVMNPVYREEIEATLEELGLEPRIEVAT